MNEQPCKNIVLISVLNGSTLDYEPVAAGETLDLAIQALEEEKSKFKGSPLMFDITNKTLIRFHQQVLEK